MNGFTFYKFRAAGSWLKMSWRGWPLNSSGVPSTVTFIWHSCNSSQCSERMAVDVDRHCHGSSTETGGNYWRDDHSYGAVKDVLDVWFLNGSIRSHLRMFSFSLPEGRTKLGSLADWMSYAQSLTRRSEILGPAWKINPDGEVELRLGLGLYDWLRLTPPGVIRMSRARNQYPNCTCLTTDFAIENFLSIWSRGTANRRKADQRVAVRSEMFDFKAICARDTLLWSVWAGGPWTHHCLESVNRLD